MEHQVVSREDALKQGLKYFFVGSPCIHGHLDLRYTSSGMCKTCHRTHTRARRASARLRDVVVSTIYNSLPQVAARTKGNRFDPEAFAV